jgi:two-component system cell cycle sensor histidine kinase PleC
MHGRRPSVMRRNSLISRYSETLGELMLRRNTELAIRAAKVESDLASRAKSAFLATMSHELRTPLNAIIGFSDLIANLKAEPQSVDKGIDYASHISRAGRHLLEVVSDILDISKIESGSFSLNIQSYPIAEIIAASVAMVEARITEKQQHLELRLARSLPDIPVDPRRVKQILINLLSNANKFTPERGDILLIARRNADGGATIAVVDTGIGMTPEQLSIALTPFGQVQSHYTRTQEGTGLGLPIARGLARQHGGDLYLESEPGAGTTAVLTLPPGQTEKPGAPAATFAGGGERRKPRKRDKLPKDESHASDR